MCGITTVAHGLSSGERDWWGLVVVHKFLFT